MLVFESRYLMHYFSHALKIDDRVWSLETANDNSVVLWVRVMSVGNLKVQLKGVPSLISTEFQPDLVCWYDSAMPCEATIPLKILAKQIKK